MKETLFCYSNKRNFAAAARKGRNDTKPFFIILSNVSYQKASAFGFSNYKGQLSLHVQAIQRAGGKAVVL